MIKDTFMIDRLFLELSQVTRAQTEKDIANAQRIAGLQKRVEAYIMTISNNAVCIGCGGDLGEFSDDDCVHCEDHHRLMEEV